MSIIVATPTQCLVDGVNYGAVADVIANNPALAPGIQLALEIAWQSYAGQRDAEASAQSDAEIFRLEAEINRLQAEIARLTIQPDSLTDWPSFRAAIMEAPFFVRMFETLKVLPQGNMLSIAIVAAAMTGDASGLKAPWNLAMQMFLQLEGEISLEEVNLFRQKCEECHIPLTFADDGTIE